MGVAILDLDEYESWDVCMYTFVNIRGIHQWAEVSCSTAGFFY